MYCAVGRGCKQLSWLGNCDVDNYYSCVVFVKLSRTPSTCAIVLSVDSVHRFLAPTSGVDMLLILSCIDVAGAYSYFHTFRALTV
jgi:hypothetical protein